MRHQMSVKPDPARSRKMLVAIRAADRCLKRPLPPLIYLTDPERSHDPIAIVKQLPRNSAVIYRHFGAADRERVGANLRLITILKNSLLLIANDPELAIQVKADGVHWPERQSARAKYWRTRFAIMTASAHSRRAIYSSSLRFVDAALLSTVFSSSSRTATSPIGAIRFRQLARGAPLPIYALGGVTSDTAQRIAESGGLASISGIQEAFGA